MKQGLGLFAAKVCAYESENRDRIFKAGNDGSNRLVVKLNQIRYGDATDVLVSGFKY